MERLMRSLDEKISGATESEAKEIAERMFMNVAQPGSEFIFLDDLMHFMTEAEALKVMSLCEVAPESRQISKSSLKNWVVDDFRRQKALELALNGSETAVNELKGIVYCFFGICMIISCLVIFEVTTPGFWLILILIVIFLVSACGNYWKKTFKSIAFVFQKHPFDIGDTCEIDGEEMIVVDYNLHTTYFLNSKAGRTEIENVVLATKRITNYNRNPVMKETLVLCVDGSTTVERIETIKQSIISYVENEEYWCHSPMFKEEVVEDSAKVKITILLTHRTSHEDMDMRKEKINDLRGALRTIKREVLLGNRSEV